jgi:type I restriction enzyme R subunit
MKFTEEKLEQAFIELIQKQGCEYDHGSDIQRSPDEVIIEAELRNFLLAK